MKFIELIKSNMFITIVIVVAVIITAGAYGYMFYDKHQAELEREKIQAEIQQQIGAEEQAKKEQNQVDIEKYKAELEKNFAESENEKIEIPALPAEETAEQPAKEETTIEKTQPEFEQPQLPPNTDAEDKENPPSYEEPKPSKPQTTEPADGTKRVNNGQNEIFIKGFGWLPDSPGGTSEIADFELSGELVGY
ncbi:MAG: hypothetical protein RR073_05975 [Clostridia bacterium]